MSAIKTFFYICPSCFYCSAKFDLDHMHSMLRVEIGKPGDSRRKPVTNSFGRMVSRAPRWFYEALEKSRIGD